MVGIAQTGSGKTLAVSNGYEAACLYTILYSQFPVYKSSCAQDSWKMWKMLMTCLLSLFQYLLPAIVHINHQPFLEHGDGPIVSTAKSSVIQYPLKRHKGKVH
uniref:Uncharacterized protein n=1 Tax=Anguilla anguilla TaxID=7936 RepID=A0A0E9WN59_ANGAN